ncbi:DUF4198 domain-containing protein [Oceanisphaera sp. W20_SRM_FM3]|uniref:DUF4198 domain-containing protein n=1 Tax=Oceanisphaera sp. W20_SRM_FM3 TaxID=3240267 RepID=UPI003F95FA58
MNKRTSLLAALALVAGTASAHPVWMLPSEFNLSSEAASWVTVDASASNEVFNVDKPIGLDGVTIYNPANEPSRIGAYFKGHRRSVFDMELNTVGTYKVELQNPTRYVTQYVTDEQSTPQRSFANKIDAASQLPKAAREVNTLAMQTISGFYVTQKTPSKQVLMNTGKGFELQALTHPSDVVVGEEARFKFTYDGEPLKDLKVEVVANGTAYRDARQQLDLVTDKEGVVHFTPELAGPHLLSTNMRRKIDSPLADQAVVNYLLSFEAQAQ